MARALWFSLLLTGCGFSVAGSATGDGGLPGDSRIPDGPVPDAGPCQTLGEVCAGDTLRVCSVQNQLPTETPCAWGCASSPGPAHCAVPQFAGGAVTANDLAPTSLATKTLGAVVVNTDTGEITGSVRAAGAGIASGIGYRSTATVGVFTFAGLTLNGPVTFTGQRAVAFVSSTTITVNALIDARGSCTRSTAGPGGFAGGGPQSNETGTAGSGPGGGSPGTGQHDQASGGAGGGHGAVGSDGAASDNTGGAGALSPAGGAANGDAMITALLGGSGGGGGGGDRGGLGGGGGGAIQLVANDTIQFVGPGAINAGGCGAKKKPNEGPGDQDDGGGGGGAGGTILLEAANIILAGTTILAVNGGGGGGGDGGGQDGQPGRLDRTAANGGNGSGPGGDGGDPSDLSGDTGTEDRNGGGGGGAIGRIRFTTRGGVIQQNGATLSPDFTDAGTTATQGATPVQ